MATAVPGALLMPPIASFGQLEEAALGGTAPAGGGGRG